MFKPISRRLHGFTDYSYIPLVALLPNLIGFGGVPAILCRVFSGGILLSSIFTRSEWGFVRIMPYKVHLAINTLVGVLAIASPWLFSFADNALLRNAFLIIGAFGISAGLLSKPEEMGSNQSTLGGSPES